MLSATTSELTCACFDEIPQKGTSLPIIKTIPNVWMTSLWLYIPLLLVESLRTFCLLLDIVSLWEHFFLTNSRFGNFIDTHRSVWLISSSQSNMDVFIFFHLFAKSTYLRECHQPLYLIIFKIIIQHNLFFLFLSL